VRSVVRVHLGPPNSSQLSVVSCQKRVGPTGSQRSFAGLLCSVRLFFPSARPSTGSGARRDSPEFAKAKRRPKERRCRVEPKRECAAAIEEQKRDILRMDQDTVIETVVFLHCEWTDMWSAGIEAPFLLLGDDRSCKGLGRAFIF
jgi:hypothetical protein